MKQNLLDYLDRFQQNGIADILIKIKNSGNTYDKTLYVSIENSLNPLSLSLMANSLVQSTKTLINSMNINGNNNFIIQGVNNSNINISNDWRKEVHKFIARAELKQALNKVVGNQNVVIQLSGRLSRLERGVMLGTIDSRDEKLERNDIVQAILSLCEETQEEYSTTYQQIEEPKIMNKYQILSKTDCAVELLRFFSEIAKSPANRLRVNVIQREVTQCQEVMKYTKLQTLLGVIATLSVNPKVDNFHDIVFKNSYDEMVTSMINTLTTYISVADKHATTNETPANALSRLENDKTIKNLKLWVESMKKACGSRVKLSDKLTDKLDYWLHCTKNVDEEELEIIIDNQIINDFQLYCNQNEI